MHSKMLSILCGFGAVMYLQNQVVAAEPIAAAGATSTSTITTVSTSSAPATSPLAASPAAASPAAAPQAATPPAATRVTVTPAAPVAPPDPKAIEEQVRDLTDTLKKTYDAAQNLQSECNRVYNADALDNVIMDPWMEGQPGLAHVMPPPFPGALKPMPARKKWVDYDQEQITKLLRMLTGEVNAIGAASSIDTSIKVTVEILQDNLQQIDEQYARLNSLTNPSTTDDKGQPNYDKPAITKTAQALKDETSGLNEVRKRLLRQLKDLDKR